MSTSRKPRLTFNLEQKLDYAKLMVNEDYSTNIKAIDLINGHD